MSWADLALIVADPGGTLLALDFDGTLAHIVDDPATAFGHAHAVDALVHQVIAVDPKLDRRYRVPGSPTFVLVDRVGNELLGRKGPLLAQGRGNDGAARSGHPVAVVGQDQCPQQHRRRIHVPAVQVHDGSANRQRRGLFADVRQRHRKRGIGAGALELECEAAVGWRDPPPRERDVRRYRGSAAGDAHLPEHGLLVVGKNHVRLRDGDAFGQRGAAGND